MYSVSAHSKDPKRKLTLLDEIEAANRRLDEIQSLAGSHVTFVEGNHEDRLRRYIWDKAPELDGITDTATAIRIRDRGWAYRGYRDYYRLGPVTYTHDIGRAGVNAARQSLLDYGGNLVFGHSHRGAVVYQGEAKGASHFCMNVGWLGDVAQVDYMHRARAERDWQLGFGIVDYSDDLERASATFVPIVDSRCVVHGREVV